jgi:hypothetical protein
LFAPIPKSAEKAMSMTVTACIRMAIRLDSLSLIQDVSIIVQIKLEENKCFCIDNTVHEDYIKRSELLTGCTIGRKEEVFNLVWIR